MFKLIAVLFLAVVVAAKPDAIISPVYTGLVSEKVIESHGNSVVHASSPVVQYPTFYNTYGVLPSVPSIPLAYSAYYRQPTVYYN